jgi:hypothetical protein
VQLREGTWRYERSLMFCLDEINLCPANNAMRWRLAGIFEYQDYSRLVGTGRIWRIEHIAINDQCLIRQEIGSQFATPIEDHDPNSKNQRKKLKESNNTGYSSYLVAEIPSIKPPKEPSVAPLLWSLLAAGCGFLLCLLGGQYLDDERRLLGAALLGVGLLLGALAILPWGFL